MKISNPYRLVYFNVRGKAEAIRALLEDQQIPYKEHRYTMDEWKEVKTSFPFHQLPLLEDGDLKIPQTQAILRYLARKHNLYGKNELESLRCDVFQEVILDAREELVRFFLDKDFEEKREKFTKENLHLKLTLLNYFYIKNDTGFCVGKDVTYVDYLLWVYLDYVRAFSTPSLEQFPKLYEFKKGFESRKNIENYLKSERRPKVFTLPRFKFGNTIETS